MRLLITLAALMLFFGFTAPAHAAYCDDFPGEARFPEGPCETVHSAQVNWGGGSSTMYLMIEAEARRGISAARLAELTRMVDEVAAAAGPAIARIGGLRLQDTIHLVVVNDSAGPSTYAETLRRNDEESDCPMLLFRSGGGGVIGATTRSVAHELFHCIQYKMWPSKMRAEGHGWWSEGSAEWFEDYALPGRVRDSDLLVAMGRFGERAGRYSLLDGAYGNVVLFSWLGPRRIVPFIHGLADEGMTQLAGAARTLDGDEWIRFAQAYIDETIQTPSGMRVAGSEFVPPLQTLHTTTGRPGDDPMYTSPRPVPPLTLMSGVVEFVPGDYAPTGRFGTRSYVFAERPGGWGDLPSPLRVECNGMKKMRVAAYAVVETKLRVDPGTRSGASRTCGCPVGSWTIPAEGLMQFAPANNARLVSQGEVEMRFDAGGTARFIARNLVFELPERSSGRGGAAISVQVQISRTYEGTWSWTTEGDRITMNAIDLMTTTERTTHSVRGPAPLGGVHTQPARSRTIESDNHDRRVKQFSCEGNTLKITDPLDRVGLNQWRVPSMNLTRYPRSGIFVRQ